MTKFNELGQISNNIRNIKIKKREGKKIYSFG